MALPAGLRGASRPQADIPHIPQEVSTGFILGGSLPRPPWSKRELVKWKQNVDIRLQSSLRGDSQLATSPLLPPTPSCTDGRISILGHEATLRMEIPHYARQRRKVPNNIVEESS